MATQSQTPDHSTTLHFAVDSSKILYLEPYYGGSHKQLITLLQREYGGDVYSLPASKWHWRMRTSALYFAEQLPQEHQYKILFASSVLNMCELVALWPDLNKLHKILYFHENQLIYPVRKQQERDFQYGYNQILSCLVADKIVFNSHFNMTSFLENIDPFLKLMPDFRPSGLFDKIRPKCSVLYYPLEIPEQVLMTEINSSPTIKVINNCSTNNDLTMNEPSCDHQTSDIDLLTQQKPLHIVWPHRWEHDKGPEELCSVLQKLLEADLKFRISILGDHTEDIPVCFQDIFPVLGPRLLHCGPVSKEDYWSVLHEADVVISTAKHEFFGVAMLEATCCGCYPLCPNRLVYPEIYPEQCLYNTEQQLFKKLRNLCQRPYLAQYYRKVMSFKANTYLWKNLQISYQELLKTS